MRVFILIFFVLFTIACNSSNNKNQQELTEETSVTAIKSEEAESIQEAVSFMGEPLYRKTVDEVTLVKSDSIIQSVRARTELTEDDYHTIGLAHIMAYRFRDAIDNYTEGLEKYPDSFQLLRHRGHRYLNVRETEKAIADLMKADELIGDQYLDVMEYNSDGSQKGTFKFWVGYHLALYHIFNQQWEEAADAYRICLENAALPNNVSGASAWLYMVYQKMGESEKAEALIAPLDENFEGDQDYIYFRRIMLYQGRITPEDLMDLEKPVDQWTGREMTIAYGIADWYEQQGDTQKANEIYRNILETLHWNPWAYVVTESIIANLS